MAMLEVYAYTPLETWYTFTFWARVMVLMCGLVLTLFAVVEFALTPARTSAAVYEALSGAAATSALAACVVAASALPIASGVMSARVAAAATAKRERFD